MRIYGPYIRKDGRSHIIIINKDGTRYTQSYPRFLMEQSLGRKLERWEQVDHINDNVTDNNIENFQLLSQSENIRKSKHEELVEIICVYCGQKAIKKMKNVKANKKKGKSGPYCSRRCAGLVHN